jgi:hypothetical protein
LDTPLTNAVDVFNPNSLIKMSPVRQCPHAVLILRVIQMLCGIAAAGGLSDSVMEAWLPTAHASLDAAAVAGCQGSQSLALPVQLPVSQLLIE